MGQTRIFRTEPHIRQYACRHITVPREPGTQGKSQMPADLVQPRGLPHAQQPISGIGPSPARAFAPAGRDIHPASGRGSWEGWSR